MSSAASSVIVLWKSKQDKGSSCYFLCTVCFLVNYNSGCHFSRRRLFATICCLFTLWVFTVTKVGRKRRFTRTSVTAHPAQPINKEQENNTRRGHVMWLSIVSAYSSFRTYFWKLCVSVLPVCVRKILVSIFPVGIFCTFVRHCITYKKERS